jgi:hypothetical protein
MATFLIPFIVLSQEIVVEETNVTPSQVTVVIIVAALAEWPTATNTSPINEGFRMSLGKNPENMSEVSRKRMAFLSALVDSWRSFIVSPGTTRPALTGYADAFLPGNDHAEGNHLYPFFRDGKINAFCSLAEISNKLALWHPSLHLRGGRTIRMLRSWAVLLAIPFGTLCAKATVLRKLRSRALLHSVRAGIR